MRTKPIRHTLRRLACAVGFALLPTCSPAALPAQTLEPIVQPSATTQARMQELIVDVLEPDIPLELDPAKSKLIRTRKPVDRFSITNPEICEVVQFGPTEFELIGGTEGQTTLTLWFGSAGEETQLLRYLIRVRTPDDRGRLEYGELQKKINEMFPNSMVQLIPIADKLIVRGQARDAEEATQIMGIIRGEATDQTGQQLGPGSMVVQGTAAEPYPGATDLPSYQVISMMDVPGEQQVMLKVRVAELNRAALRSMGADLTVNQGSFNLESLLGLGGTGAIRAVLDTDEVRFVLEALSSNSYSKILAEPNLVTLNGNPASFIAGGEFAVPVVVGVEGAAAATTNFRGFGTQLTFTPTIIDKDRIRLFVAPSVSSINDDLTNEVSGVPGLNARAVATTVDLREGQWLAIAGLIQDQQTGSKVRVPLLGDIPILGTLFSRREVTREETELIVLVSPELVHPMEPEETPMILPGMEVTEPGDWQFFGLGRYEGCPDCDHRSTVFPIHQDRVVDSHAHAWHEAKMIHRARRAEKHYVQGPHGFSQ